MNDITYITLLGSVTGNDKDGFTVGYEWDGRQFSRKEEAVSNGFAYRRADDFNIGVVVDGKLSGLWWMEEQLDASPGRLAAIGQQIGL